MKLTFSNHFSKSFITEKLLNQSIPIAEHCHKILVEKTGKGNDFLGWLSLPSEMLHANSLLQKIQKLKEIWLKQNITHVVVVGIGGSYLGSKAIADWLLPAFETSKKKQMKLIFAGHQMSGTYLQELMLFLKNKNFGIIVISKSGTTLEPALSFRFLEKLLYNTIDTQSAGSRIIAITDSKKGALKKLADLRGWNTFEIPDDVGGRYSVLSPVGLVPLAFAGIDIEKLLQGAFACSKSLLTESSYDKNPAIQYAATRYCLYNSGKPVEILCSFEPQLQYLIEWWKQLYGESEGKQNRGIFPAGAIFSTDLHSMGQYIQEGLRIIFETYITIEKAEHNTIVEENIENADELNYLAGTSVDEIQKKAEKATILAHIEGGVPVSEISIPEKNAYYTGQLVYFFEFACAIAGYMINVNPFDQPGVEAYKKNMFALLGKPGMEEETKQILKKLNINV